MNFTYIHKEGRKIVITTFLALLLINVLLIKILDINKWIENGFLAWSIFFFCFVLYFFRNPKRNIITDDNKIIAKQGGTIAGNTRKAIEAKTGKKVVSSLNAKKLLTNKPKKK